MGELKQQEESARLQNYQAVSRDKGFMEQSLIALKKRNEELEPKLQQCEV